MSGFDLHYSAMGAGTVQEPVVVSFSFTGNYRPSLESLRAQLPDTVTLEVRGTGSFQMTGVDSAMTRVEILRIFDRLMEDNSWRGKHQA